MTWPQVGVAEVKREILIFAGPSLNPNLKKEYLEYQFRGPALQGDIAHAANCSNANIFVIVDGYYKSVPSIWHKEIIYANNKGKIIVGCSSLGAIRAAELDNYGMIGRGKVYQWYKNNEITRDPDVAVAHGPKEEDYISYTVPIVNIKASLEFSDKEIKAKDIEETLQISREIFFEHRTMPSLLKKIKTSDLKDKEKICYILENEYIDQKKSDCTETIGWISSKPEIEWIQQEPVQETIYWNALLINDTYKGQEEGGLDHTKQAALTFQLINKTDEYFRMRNQARMIDYSTWLAKIHGVECSEEEKDKVREEIMMISKISNDEIEKELHKRGMTIENFDNYVETIALYRKIKASNDAGNLYMSQNATHYRMMMLSPYWTTIDKGLTKMSRVLEEEFYDINQEPDTTYFELMPKDTQISIEKECEINHLDKNPNNIESLAGIPYRYIIEFAKKYKFYEESLIRSIKNIFSHATEE